MAKLGGMIYQAKSLERLGGMRKDRIALGNPDSIEPDGTT